MGDRTKEWRVGRVSEETREDERLWQDEILYLQGLVRCRDCETPYPEHLETCPHCEAKTI